MNDMILPQSCFGILIEDLLDGGDRGMYHFDQKAFADAKELTWPSDSLRRYSTQVPSMVV